MTGKDIAMCLSKNVFHSFHQAAHRVSDCQVLTVKKLQLTELTELKLAELTLKVAVAGRELIR